MRLAQVAQHVDDLERASGFYEYLLEQSPTATFDPPGLVFFDLGGTRLLLDRGAPSSLLYFGVGEIDAALSRLRERSVPIESEPHVIFSHDDGRLGPAQTDEWMAFVRDSENNLIGLVEHRARA